MNVRTGRMPLIPILGHGTMSQETTEFKSALSRAEMVIVKGLRNWMLFNAMAPDGLPIDAFYLFQCRSDGPAPYFPPSASSLVGIDDGLVVAYVPAGVRVTITLAEFARALTSMTSIRE